MATSNLAEYLARYLHIKECNFVYVFYVSVLGFISGSTVGVALAEPFFKQIGNHYRAAFGGVWIISGLFYAHYILTYSHNFGSFYHVYGLLVGFGTGVGFTSPMYVYAFLSPSKKLKNTHSNKSNPIYNNLYLLFTHFLVGFYALFG